MCGIAGIINLNRPSFSLSAAVQKMTTLLKHRGPDDEGFVFFNEHEYLTCGGKDTSTAVWDSLFPYSPSQMVSEVSNHYLVAFGFRRLSILDLSPAGHQPMCSEDKNLWIVFNGEIYNYIELREELKNKGYRFRTTTDTEVILAAYKEWGEKCIERFNGMWAFVIYDRKKMKMFGARDRFGVKPLYYYKDENVFLFASELKASVQQPFVKTAMNKKMVFDYLVLGETEAEEEGFFQHVFELPPAYVFDFDIKNKSFERRKYYTLPYNTDIEKFDAKKSSEYILKTKELVQGAVKLRLRSDVPVGSCLSGGLDSSAIVCVTGQLLNDNIQKQLFGSEKQKVFTACFHNREIDESRWAKAVVEHTQTEWHRVFPTAEGFAGEIEQLLYCQDIPVWNTSTYSQFKVMQLAKENGIKVVLDGQGGDELFAGYPHYHIAFLTELLQNHVYSGFLNELNGFSGFSAFVKKLIRYNLIHLVSVDYLAKINKRFFKDTAYINTELWNNYKERFEKIKNINTSAAELNRMLHNEFNYSYLKGYLKCEDRCSMWFSVESRTPFADDINLIEYIFSLPSAYKIHHGTNKYLLRESMKTIIPEAIRNRKDKMGYTTPLLPWLFATKDKIRSYFTSDLHEYVDTKKLLKDFDKSTEQLHPTRIFRYILFAVWKKVYGI